MAFNDKPNYLLPLVYSNNADDYYQQLTDLSIAVFNATLAARVADAQTMGVAYLQSFDELKRALVANGLEPLAHSLDDTALRYLYKLWITRNQDRGTYFLEALLQVLLGSNVTIEQVWHDKDLEYPNNPTSPNAPNSFLTSRINITTYYNSQSLPIVVLKKIASLFLPARLVLTYGNTDIKVASETLYFETTLFMSAQLDLLSLVISGETTLNISAKFGYQQNADDSEVCFCGTEGEFPSYLVGGD